MKLNQRWLAILMLLTLLCTSITTLAQDSVKLVPYTSAAFGYESVIPEGWTEAGPGTFVRQSNAADRTVLVQQAAPLAPDKLLTAMLPQLALTTAPESVGTHQGKALEWTLYKVDVSVGAINVAVDLALAAGDGKTYVVLLQTAPEDFDTLHQSIFLPVLDALTPLKPAEEAVPYDVEEVTFQNGDVTLAGTLTLPPTAGKHPAVVLVSGSGPQDRDESLGGGIAIKPFHLLADALTRAGVAVLRYDDRGAGKSTGDFASATTRDFAADAAAAISYLLTHSEISADQIGLLGHSEGGLIAALLGAEDKNLAFVIALGGPAVIGRDVLIQQNKRIMAAAGMSQDMIDSQADYVEQLIATVDDPAAMEELIYQRTLEQLKALPAEKQAELGNLEDYARLVAQQGVKQNATAWFKEFVSYDPSKDWAKTTIPVLAIYGAKDVQVDAQQNAPALEAALKQAGNTDYQIVTLPDANHLFQTADTGAPTEYGKLPAEFTPELLPTILEWLQKHVTIAK
ncbi:MAG: alpha/beta hydrolase [Anaerolineae bacterium]